MSSRAVRALVWTIQLYRTTVSPLRLPTCRFTPTCSQYAVDALTEFGVVRGGWLAMVRLLKCGPWHNGGWDPIPDRRASCDRHSDATAVRLGVPGTEPDDVHDPEDQPDQQGKSLPRV
ncbi:membrane protein insertion efficiency factor YidD [Mycolicibacterium sp. 018/SC-01/001]|nr:membrane protein insertion efficiency factor YidD [Mycolicibacterium sp. 018/SC-01/001]TRW89227.1 membrane protein insertion efficiency factor YidD [Mycolicibacterium sp. 018/SC-01/001]